MADDTHKGLKFIAGEPPPRHGPAPSPHMDQGLAVFPKVVMTGRHGLACAEFQELTFHGLTQAQIGQYKWNYFGVCGAVVTCYDAAGQVVSSG